MKVLDFPIVLRRGRGLWPSGETALHLPGTAWVVEFPARQTRSDRPRAAVLDDDGWRDWPPNESAGGDLTF